MTDRHEAGGAPGRRPGSDRTTGRVSAGDRVGADRARSVRVFAPGEPDRRRALCWATRHASRTGASVQVLVDPRTRGGDQAGPDDDARLVARPVRDLDDRARAPRPGPAPRDLVRAVAGARLLVVPASLPRLTTVVEMLPEPLAVVPDRPLPPEGADVVLALASWTGPEVVGAAFETAARYGVVLRVVHGVEPGDDTAEATRTCHDDLALWRLVHPEVTVEVEVVDGVPVGALVRHSADAQLVVVGRPARGRARELIAPSPSSRLLRTARCPVLVVPPPGVLRATWTARRGWGRRASDPP